MAFIEGLGKFSSLNSTYESNFAVYGGAINVNDEGVLAMINSTFLRNKAKFGSILTMFSSFEKSFLDGILIKENKAVIPDYANILILKEADSIEIID